MTIEFNCPNCGALIAFDSQHSGKRARCLSCGQKFVIPAQNFDKPQKIAPEPEPRGEPIPGFARAVFVDTWKLFTNRANVTTLTFVTAVVAFRFFLANGACCSNYVITVIAWAWLFGFYLNVIYQTAFDDDELPPIELGTSLTFAWYVIYPLFTFAYTLAMVEIPFFIGLFLLKDTGVNIHNFGSAIGPLHLLLQFLFLLGLFFFPAAILTVAVGKDFALLRPGYLLIPVCHAFGAYVVVVLLLAAGCFVLSQAGQFDATAAPWLTILHLVLNLLVQIIMLFAMRAIGLFYRHYGCYFKW